ncbi:IclR family transcriptional regulator domain-containing protein, partial [Rhodopseudomonas palustris]
TSIVQGLQLRNLIRSRLEEVAGQIPGTVGFLIPDRFHMVYLEYARAPHALGLHSVTGSRIAMARTAAGNAYTAALDEDVASGMLAEMQRENPGDAAILRERIDANRAMLRERGYVTTCGVWSPHISGIAMPIWSPQYQTYVVVNIGLLSAMYSEARMFDEVAPALLELGGIIGALVQNGEPIPAPIAQDIRPASIPNKNNNTEDTHDLEAGTGRTRPARILRAADGRR